MFFESSFVRVSGRRPHFTYFHISHIRWPMNLHRGLDYAILEEIKRDERGERREERSLKYSLIPQSLHDNMLKRSTSEDGYTIDVNTGRRNDKQGEDETKRETMRLRGDPLTLTHRQLAQIIWLMSLGWFKCCYNMYPLRFAFELN